MDGSNPKCNTNPVRWCHDETTYTQLRPEERVVISSMKLMGESTRAIACVLSRPASTISRELHRNRCPSFGFTSDSARAMYALRRRIAKPPAKLHLDSVAWHVVLTCWTGSGRPRPIADVVELWFTDTEPLNAAYRASAQIDQLRSSRACGQPP